MNKKYKRYLKEIEAQYGIDMPNKPLDEKYMKFRVKMLEEAIDKGFPDPALQPFLK